VNVEFFGRAERYHAATGASTMKAEVASDQTESRETEKRQFLFFRLTAFCLAPEMMMTVLYFTETLAACEGN